MRLPIDRVNLRSYWDYLFGAGKAAPPRLHVSLDLTYRCNHRCNMCFLYGDHLDDEANPRLQTIKEREELSLDQWQEMLRELRKAGIRRLVMTGGEVFMKEGFLDLLEFAKRSGFSVSVLSNGALITERFARRFVSIRPNFIRFSLDGDRETHNLICGVSTYDKLLTSIDRIRAQQREQGTHLPRLGFETVIQRHNQDKLHHVIETAAEKGIEHVTMSNIFFTSSELGQSQARKAGNGGQTTREIDAELYAVDTAVVDEELQRVRELAKRLGVQLQCRLGCRDDIEQIYRNPSFSFLNKCLYPWMMLRINPYGDVIPCTGSTASMGNVREEPFLAIWNGQRYREFRRDLKKQGLLADCLKCNTLAERRFGVWNFLPRVFN